MPTEKLAPSSAYRRVAVQPGLVLGQARVSGFARHFHLDYHFGIVVQGLQRQRFQQQNVVLDAGAVSCMPPGEMHDGQVVQGSQYELLTFRLDAVRWHRLCSEIQQDDRIVDLAPAALHVPGLAQRMVAWHRAQNQGAAMRLAVDSEWLEIVAQLAKTGLSLTPFSGAEARLSQVELRRLLDYAQAHLAEAISLDQLAGLTRLNRFQFLRAFKQSTGMTPYAWFKCLRLEHACVLLQHVAGGGMTIAQVAQEVGFYDQSHFNRAFRQSYGVAPSAY